MFKFNTASASPPGVLPKNMNRVILCGIAVVIVLASAFSGKKERRVDEKTIAQPGPSREQLENFRKSMEKARRELDEEKRRLEQAKLKPVLPPPPPPQYVQRYSAPAPYSPPPDPGRTQRAKASNIAFTVPDPEPDRSALTAWRAEQPADAQARDEDEPEKAGPEQSGEFLPEREENGLYRLYEGTMIKTTLANALEGSFTGPVECVVSASVLSRDGTVLISEGSRFIGEAHKVSEQNQTRLAVSFKRLLMPNGYSVKLKPAPGLDSAGTAGLKGRVNNRRARTFASAGAMGLIGGLSNLFSFGRGTSVIVNPTGNAAMNSLSRYSNTVPSITIRAGHAVMVYLPTDLLIPAYDPERTSK